MSEIPGTINPSCHHKKSNGDYCKRPVSIGEGMCWQHARSWKHKFRSLSKNQQVIFVFAILGIALTTFFGIITWPHHQTSRNGHTTSVTPKFKDAQTGEYYATVGDNRIMVWPNSWAVNGRTHLLSDTTHGRAVLEAFVQDGQILIDAYLLSDSGLPVSIVGNNITNAPGWDRNFDDSAVEIVNESGMPMLQIIYQGPHYAVIYGVFAGEGRVTVVTPKGIISNPVNLKDAPGYPLKRLFRYPSRLYQGLEVGTE